MIPTRLSAILLAVGALAWGCACPPSTTEDRPERDPATLTPEAIALMQTQMAEAMVPGPEHEMLARYAGSWALETKMWMSPDAEPMTMHSTAEAEMILGGRYLMSRGSSSFMGQQVETLSLLGFDRRSDEFTVEAYDTMGTYSVGGRGPLSADGTSAVMRGTDYDAIGQMTQVYDFVMTWIDDDTFTFEVIFHDKFHAPDGVPFKMVEVTNRRQ